MAGVSSARRRIDCGRTEVAELRHQRHVEQFGKQHEVRAYGTHRIDEELGLLQQRLERVDRPHLPLDQTDPHQAVLALEHVRLFLIVDVVPLDQGRVGFRFGVKAQVVGQHLAHMEAIGDLETQHRIVDFLERNPFDVFLGRHLLRMFGVAGDATAGDDRAQAVVLAERLARFIETSCQTHVAIGRVDHDVEAVKHIAIRIVGAEGVLARDVLVAVRVAEAAVVDDQA